MSTPTKESGSPINDQGSNYNYRSNIARITPNVPGAWNIEIMDRTSEFEQNNRTVKVPIR